ncbi:MAG: response regulator [Opitutaceae bacterium]|nr:response regulator [Opitutaceae bacterium]
MPSHHILVVDDEAEVRNVTKLLLEMSGYTAVCVNDGRAALRALPAGKFDCVLTDMLMPEMDGVELLNELRRRHTSLRIVAMSGGGQAPKESYLQMAKHCGAHILLPKPFNREQLDIAIKQAFGELPTKSDKPEKVEKKA